MSDQSALTTTPKHSAYSSIEAFESAQRMARSLAESDIVPALYQGKLGNCIVALDIANRMGMGAVQVMQNLNVIRGEPSWKTKFVIGLIQSCGRFEDFDFVETPDSCQCVARVKGKDKLVDGVKITMDMAKREGWTRNSKWSTMPQTMLRYRAASSFGNFHIPDLLLGIQTVEDNEVIDAEIEVVEETPQSKLNKVNEILAPKTDPVPVPEPEPVSDVIEPDDFFD